MSDCPRCFHELERLQTEGGVSWQCPDCGGLLATLPFLRRRLSVEAANRIWQTAREAEPGSSPRQCPFCGKDMVRVRSEFNGRDIELDACLPCQAFWFDRGEIESLPEAPPPPPAETEPEISPEAKEKLVTVQMQMIQERMEMDSSLGMSTDDETTGLPSPELFPWATLLVCALSIAAWVTAPRMTCGSHFSSHSDRDYWLLLLVLGRESWVLGRSAEEELGGVRLLALWAASAIAAGIAHLAAGGELVRLGLSLAMEALLGVLVWLAQAFPGAHAAGGWRRGLFSRYPSRFWIPLPVFAAMWGVLCLFVPSMLNIEAPGTLVAMLAAAAVGFAFHRFVGRR